MFPFPYFQFLASISRELINFQWTGFVFTYEQSEIWKVCINKAIYLQFFSFYWCKYLGKNILAVFSVCPSLFKPWLLTPLLREGATSFAFIGLGSMCWICDKQLCTDDPDGWLPATRTDCTQGSMVLHVGTTQTTMGCGRKLLLPHAPGEGCDWIIWIIHKVSGETQCSVMSRSEPGLIRRAHRGNQRAKGVSN